MLAALKRLRELDKQPTIQERMENRRGIGLGVYQRIRQYLMDTSGSDSKTFETSSAHGSLRVGPSPIMKDAISVELSGKEGTSSIVSVDGEGNMVFIENESPGNPSTRSRRNDPSEVRSFVHEVLSAAPASVPGAAAEEEKPAVQPVLAGQGA